MNKTERIKKKIETKHLLDIAIAVFLVAITGVASGIFVRTDSEWFKTLIKPDFYPQPIVFMIVWSVVYALSAAVIAICLVKGAPRKISVLLYVQLSLQILWCLVFFTLELPILGFVIIAALLIINLLVEIWLMNWNETAAWLYVFPVAWFAFATVLNYAILMLN